MEKIKHVLVAAAAVLSTTAAMAQAQCRMTVDANGRNAYVCPDGQYPRHAAPLPDRSFNGDACTSGDCGGHRAGYTWAQRNRITSVAECSGKAQSFVNGCMAYAQGQ